MSETQTDSDDSLLDLHNMVPNKGDSVVINGFRITNNGTYYGVGTDPAAQYDRDS